MAAAACVSRTQTPSDESLATPVPLANERWAHGLAPGKEATRALLSGSFVVLTEARSGVLVLDARSGRELWRRGALVHVAGLANSNDVVAADRQGHVVRLGLSNGATKWQTGALCAARQQRFVSRRVEAIGGSAYVACSAGALFRLDARTGRTRAALTTLAFDGVEGITPLPLGALAVRGWSSGSTTRTQLALVRADDFRAIVPTREETQLVGVVGDTAILDDLCCHGRTDAYRPATIVNVNLRTGATSEPLDLQPDPDLFPPGRQGPGQGWNGAAIAGNHLFLGIAPMLYDFGDARAPARVPARLLTNLAAPPTYLADGSAFVVVQPADGRQVAELIDLRSRPMRIRARLEGGAAASVTYDAGASPGALQVLRYGPKGASPIVVRVSDGAEVVVPVGCRLLASTEEAAFSACVMKAGAFAGGYLVKFAFPQ